MNAMESESNPEAVPVCGANFSIGGNSIEEVFVKFALLLAKHDWPGFSRKKYKKSQRFEIILPGGPRFALENGLAPLEVKLTIKICPSKGTRDHERSEWSVLDYSNMSYGMRLARGFAILSGNKHDL